MPYRKKPKVLPAKPGKCRQYIEDNFMNIPDDYRTCQKGHILLMYYRNDISTSKTARHVSQHFGIATTFTDVTRIVNDIIKKTTNWSRVDEVQKFVSLCSELFFNGTPSGSEHELTPPAELPCADVVASSSLLTTPSKTVPSVFPPAPVSSATQTTSSVCLRGDVVTPRKASMRRRLKFVSESRRAERRRHLEEKRELKSRIKNTAGITKTKNQAIKRKQQTINKLKTKLKEMQQGSYMYKQLKKAKAKNIIHQLKADKLYLEDQIQDSSSEIQSKKDCKTYSTNIRMMVYDGLVTELSTENIPVLIEKYAKRLGVELTEVPGRSTVEQMARELGVISDLQASEIAMKTEELTLAFDATTQEGMHVNCIHYTTKSLCQVLAFDELADGTAEDYAQHILDSVDHLALTYCDFHGADFQACRNKLISHMSNTLTDYASVNHLTIHKVSDVWGKSLNELNCHLHPLDTVASSCRQALRKLETKNDVKGQLFGKDCLAANIVLAMNKMRYKDGKGDPKGFIAFLDDKGLPRGILPRYRGNRLHVLFHICGKLVLHHRDFLTFLTENTNICGGLIRSLQVDLEDPTAVRELYVLALLGKLLSGPWMKRFYTAVGDQTSYLEGVSLVKKVLEDIIESSKDPMHLLSRTTDFFGQHLEEDDVLTEIRVSCPGDDSVQEMLAACLAAVKDVIVRQCQFHFDMEQTDQLRKETASARPHNIDSEEMMGMLSAAKRHAPNATLCCLSSKIRAKKNATVHYLDTLDKDMLERVVKWAITAARKTRQRNSRKQSEMKQEVQKRQVQKRHLKDVKAQRALEVRLKQLQPEDISTSFPDLSDKALQDVFDLLSGKAVGKSICHIWFDKATGKNKMYEGRVEKMKKNKTDYVVSYFQDAENPDDGTDYKLDKYELASDVISGDLLLS